jgi:hypothetical protein
MLAEEAHAPRRRNLELDVFHKHVLAEVESPVNGDLIFKVEFTIKDSDMIVSRDFDKIEL